jgi:hypothetical protein
MHTRVGRHGALDDQTIETFTREFILLGRLSVADDRVTIPLSIDPGTVGTNWLRRRMDSRGDRGPPPPATSDVAVFRVARQFKHDIRIWLEARSGLTRDFVFPTAWHQPHLERFAASHGRTAPF